MAKSKTEKFSTRVRVPGGCFHGETQFVKITHCTIRGRRGSRTTVFRYKGKWWKGNENPTKVGSFVQGAKSKAPEGFGTPQKAAAKKARSKGKVKAKKAPSRKPKAKKKAKRAA